MRARRVGAVVTLTAIVACLVPAVGISIARGELLGLFPPDLGAAVSFAVVGAFLLLRGAVRNIATIVCVQGVGAAATTLLGVLAHLGPDHGRLPTAVIWAGWLNNFVWLPGVVLLTHLTLLFPNGTYAGPRWRWPERVVTGLAAVYVVVAATVRTSVVDGRPYREAPSPTGFIRLDPAVGDTLGSVLFLGLVTCLFVSLGSLIVRRRRAVGVERAQLTSLLYGGALSVLLIGGLSFSAHQNVVLFAIELFAVAPVAVGIGVAVLRYRLYEIDKVVSRTVAYVLVLAVLAGVYIGVVAGLANLVPSRYGQVGVAVATLLVSILAVPLTRRVRRAIDRRFDRRRFDAERVVAAFAMRLRARPERGDVPTDLLEVVHRTVAPAHAGVWLVQS